VILAMSEEGRTLTEERFDNSEDDADDVDMKQEQLSMSMMVLGQATMRMWV
jgi:hypothetical protein